ncbi:MAG: trypsin-like peptidase domain-containing protein [Dehalococcoidia bacterium]|nr:trypsin-like peptidase domain-containing protein [Dehalococcoidia bacterium]
MTLADTIARIQPYVVQIICPDKGTGTGFVIDHYHGLVLTNAHVVGPYTTVNVRLNNRDYYGYVISKDTMADLAIVDIDPNIIWGSIPLVGSSQVRHGENVIAAGYPQTPSIRESSFTVTRGIVSSIKFANGIEHIQTDAAINPGNSGGPLLNEKGEAIGINTWVANYNEAGAPLQSMGFAVGADEYKKRFKVTIKNDRVEVVKTVEDPNQWSLYSDPLDGWSIYVPPGWEQHSRSDAIIFAGIAADGQAAYLNVSAQTVPIRTTIIDYSSFYIREMVSKNLTIYQYRYINNILTKQEYSEIRHDRKSPEGIAIYEVLAHIYKNGNKIIVAKGDILFRAKPTQLNWYPVQEILDSFRTE